MTLPSVLTDTLALPPGNDPNVIRLMSIMVLSNAVEVETCPFQRRLRLNELQAAIQSAAPDIEAMAEGVMLGSNPR